MQGRASAANLTLTASLALMEHERWYVARTQPQREAQAGSHLGAQNYRVFVPRFLKNRRHARKVETIYAPLFPRYIFVILDLERDRWRSVNGTRGVDRLLMSGSEPQPVPHGVVESLIDVSDPDGNVCFDFHLQQGQMVKVTAGPFAELIGQLTGLDDRGRVHVLLELLGGKVSVALPQGHVAPATAGA